MQTKLKNENLYTMIIFDILRPIVTTDQNS